MKNGVKRLKLTEEPNDVQVSSGLLPFILWHFRTKLGNMCFRDISILGGGVAESLPPPKKRKPSSLYLLSKFVYLTSQLCHSLVMHAFVRKILDPALAFVVFQPVLDSKIHVAQEFNFHSDCVIGLFFCFLS